MRPLPGIPTIATLMLAAVLACFLPVNGSADFGALKEWQTLIAGMCAIAAATIAYGAASHRVRFDRELARDATRMKTLGICMRLDYYLDMLAKETAYLEKKFRPELDVKRFDFHPKDLRLETLERANLEEAWSNLELLGVPLSLAVARVRQSLLAFIAVSNSFTEAVVTVELSLVLGAKPKSLHGVSDMASRARALCDDARALLRVTMDELVKNPD